MFAKAPANELMENVLKLEVDFTDDELAELNDSGVNCLRAIRGGGIRRLGRENAQRPTAMVICQCKAIVSDIDPMDQKEYE